MTLEQLHANREALRAEWLRRVAEAKARGVEAADFYATGPILMRDNTLVLFVTIDGGRAYDLIISADGVISEVAA